jgi:hypothetical protein
MSFMARAFFSLNSRRSSSGVLRRISEGTAFSSMGLLEAEAEWRP